MMKKLLASLLLYLSCSGLDVQAQSLSLSPFQLPSMTSLSLPKTTFDASPAATEMWCGYWTAADMENLYFIGAGSTPMKYSAAIGYPAGSSQFMLGKTVEGIHFMAAPSAHLKNLRVWISTFLPETPEQADVCCQPVTGELQMSNEVRFNTPYQVDTESSLFVGYAFDIEGGNEDYDNYPIVFAQEPAVPNSFLLQLGGNRGQWIDYVDQHFGVLAIRLLISGENQDIDVAFNTNLGKETSTVEGKELTLNLRNFGKEGVKSLKVATEVGDVTAEQNVVLPQPVQGINEPFSVKVPIVVPQEAACYPYKVSVLQVNGKPLPAPVSQSSEMYVVTERVPHKVVIEEFTGMWCGHCPRGMFAMEKLKEIYGNQVVLIAAHSSDAISCKDYENYIQQTVSGFPSAHIDRTMMGVDPYFGNGTNFGIKELVDQQAEIVPLAQVTAKPERNGEVVTATADVKFL